MTAPRIVRGMATWEASREAATAADWNRPRYLEVSPAIREALYWLIIEEVRRLEAEARKTNRRSPRATTLGRQADTLRALADELAR